MNTSAAGTKVARISGRSAMASLLAGWLIFTPAALYARNNQAITPSLARAPGSQISAPRNTLAQPPGSSAANKDIKVHGHWTIVVKNPDGSVVSTNSFENALVAGSGDILLAQILGHKGEIGGWVVDLVIPGTSQVSLFERPASQTANSLTLTLGNGTIVLAGTGRATANGNISGVNTRNNYCATNDTPDSCPDRPVTVTATFSSHTLATPIPVQQGQAIDVTVTFSFS